MGWALFVRIRFEDTLHTETLLTLGKESLLRAAEGSKSLYVLGYKGRPFQPQPSGFVATLGGMEDESQACWGMYEYGCCRQGGTCRWQHPAHTVPISVVVSSKVMPAATLT